MKALATALIAAQAEMPAVEPNATANYGTYVTLDHLIARTKPVLTKNGLAIIQMPSMVDGQPSLTTTLVHGESGEAIADTMPLVLAKQDMQNLGAALTYARRYAWSAACGISSEIDDDGNQASAGAPVPGGTAAGGAAPAATSDFVWPSGKHSGKALADTPTDYLSWYADKGPKEDVRALCNAFLLEGELVGVGAVEQSSFYAPDDPDSDGIPF